MNLFIYRCIVLLVFLVSCQPNPNANKLYVKRNYYGAKLEDSVKIINGAGQDLTGLYDYIKATRLMPKMYMDYASLANMPEVSKLRIKSTFIPKTAILQLGLNLTAYINGRDKPIDKYVTFGEYDKEIDHLVNTLNELDRPILIRIGFEFDAPWNGYTPVYYKQTFIRITTALRKAGVNVTVWCSAGGETGKFKNLTYIMSYYPGSEYVDWIGVNLFETKDFTSLTQTSPLTTFLAKADELGKPVLIGESTPKGVGVLNHLNPGINGFSLILA